jgi:hypothetical protein
LLKQEAIPKVKFDFIVKLLMKKGDAERLCNIAVNTAKDKYTLVSNHAKVSLKIEEKLSLLGTALTVLDSSKKSLSSDQVSGFEQSIRALCDQIEKQMMVRGEIEENIEIIGNYRNRSAIDD